MAHESIKMERIFDASSALMWEALTDDERLKQWYMDFKGKFKAEVGHIVEFETGPPEGKQWLHRVEVLEVVENKKLAHTWSYPGYSGKAILTWELIEQGAEKTLLKMNFDFVELFDPNEDALHRSNFEAGWSELIDTNLANYIKQQ
ncbi:MAG: SRPBCC family protein [bacterium]